MAKSKAEIASDTVKTQLSKLTLELASFKKANATLVEERDALKKQNVQLASVIENDLKADLKMRIMASSDYQSEDLEPLTIEHLQQIETTLTKSKGFDAVQATGFKSIRAGAVDTDHSARFTTGNLYGKTRQQILEMEGRF